jgi:type II secretory pathway pseudopilin PulG
MLVVMGIILLLIAILLPAINRAYRESVRNSMAADLQVISQALEAYHVDFGDYPRSGAAPNAVPGAVILCWALIAPGPAATSSPTLGDGADGPGFRLRSFNPPQGKIYGPYLPLDRFQLGTVNPGTSTVIPNTTGGPYSDDKTVIGDRYGNVILYFPASRSVPPTVAYVSNTTQIGVVPQKSTFNYLDNSTYLPAAPLTSCSLTMMVMLYKLGDTSGNGKIDGSEAPVATTPYILWSAGPDGRFGPPVTTSAPYTTTGPDDDVTYPVLNDVPSGFAP